MNIHRRKRLGASWLAVATLAFFARSVFPCDHALLAGDSALEALIASAMCQPLGANRVADTSPLGSEPTRSPDAGTGACHASCDNACAANRTTSPANYAFVGTAVSEPAADDKYAPDSARWAVVQPRAPPLLMPRSA